MIVSHEYRFIFIKTVKTAGTSIEAWLSGRCAAGDVFTPIHPPLEMHQPRNHEGFYNHMPAFEIRERLPAQVWNGYYKFCVERNPWDKVLSLFHMLNYRSGFELSLNEFVSADNEALMQVFNYPRYVIDGHCAVDRVIRYEHLDQELGEVFSELGIPYGGSLDVHAKTEMRADGRLPWQEVYSERQRQLIATLFRPEIEMHGYGCAPADDGAGSG